MLRGLFITRSPTRLLNRRLNPYPSSNCPSQYQIRGPRHCRYTHVKRSFGVVGDPIRSQLHTNYIAIATICVAFAVSATFYSTLFTESPPQEAVKTGPVSTHPIVIEEDTIMPLPGRPGTLTAGEEAKLKDFWKAVFKILGVQTSGSAADELIEEAEEEGQANGEAATPAGKEKKKRRNIFKRKKNKETKDDEASKSSSLAASVAAGDSDDKYGQTKEFFEALANNTPEDLHRAFWMNLKCEHPDALLLRFLRARKWDIEKALVMMISTMQWRHKEMHVEEEIVRGGEGYALANLSNSDKTIQKDSEGFIDQLRKGKSYVHGVDKEGRPLTFIRVRLHHGGDQSEKSIERFTVHIFEVTRLMLQPPADTGSLLFDMTGFTLANMDYTPVKFMIKCFEANYPESLGVCIVHKAPWLFQSIWRIIRGWLDPVVAAKVHFTNSVEELENFVDKSNIVKEMGGDDPYEYGYVEPEEGENKRLEDAETRKRLEADRVKIGKEFEKLTAEWMATTDSAASAELLSQRNEVAARLKKGYWELDPYQRARSLYDRIGVLSQDGKVDWSVVVGQKSAKGKAAAAKDGDEEDSGDEDFQDAAEDGAARVAAGVEEKVSEKAAAANGLSTETNTATATEGGASTVGAGVEEEVADKAAIPSGHALDAGAVNATNGVASMAIEEKIAAPTASTPNTGATKAAAGAEEKVSNEAASQPNGPTPASHDPQGVD